MKWVLRIVGVLLGVIILLMVAGFSLLNTSWLQDKLMNQAITLLEERLQTNWVKQRSLLIMLSQEYTTSFETKSKIFIT